MVNGNICRNMSDVFRQMKEERGNRPMLRLMKDHQVTEIYGDCFFNDMAMYERQINGAHLAGKKLGLIGKNSYEWIITFYAALDTGSCCVIFGTDFNEEEIRVNALKTETEAFLCDDSVREKVSSALSGTGILVYPMAMQQDMAGMPECEGSLPENNAGLSDDAVIIFTSGTTGDKKAVVLTESALIASVTCDLVPYPFKTQLAILPFQHLAGFSSPFNTFCLGGVVCLADDLRFMFEAFEKMKPDYLFVVPSMAQVIAKRLKKATAHGESLGWDLHLLGCGGAAFPQEVLDIFEEKDIKMLQGYGASECGGIGFSWIMESDRTGTIGKANDEMEIRIEDGELLIRSASLMRGYYGDPEGTKEVLEGGWYHTGDLARQDEEGYVYLTGRKKNLIILSNGENVSPEELEQKIEAIPEVAEVLVKGEKDLLAAEIYPEGEGLEDAITAGIDLMNEKLPVYKQVKILHFRKEPFKRNAMMKIIRNQ